jgi:hypothetical protein
MGLTVISRGWAEVTPTPRSSFPFFLVNADVDVMLPRCLLALAKLKYMLSLTVKHVYISCPLSGLSYIPQQSGNKKINKTEKNVFDIPQFLKTSSTWTLKENKLETQKNRQGIEIEFIELKLCSMV